MYLLTKLWCCCQNSFNSYRVVKLLNVFIKIFPIAISNLLHNTNLVLCTIETVPTTALPLDQLLSLTKGAGQAAYRFGRLWVAQLELDICEIKFLFYIYLSRKIYKALRQWPDHGSANLYSDRGGRRSETFVFASRERETLLNRIKFCISEYPKRILLVFLSCCLCVCLFFVFQLSTGAQYKTKTNWRPSK